MEKEQLFEVEGWVRIPKRNNSIGFITTLSALNENCRVRITQDKKWGSKDLHLWIDYDKLIPCDEPALGKEDFDAIIHLALSHDDKEWFHEAHANIPDFLKDIFLNKNLRGRKYD